MRNFALNTLTVILALAVWLPSAIAVNLQQVPWDELPAFGTFWLTSPDGRLTAPLPCRPDSQDLPVFQVDQGVYLVGIPEDSGPDAHAVFSISAMRLVHGMIEVNRSSSTMALAAEDSAEISNHEKFAAHSFSILDTNTAAVTDPYLYDACLDFPDDPSSEPTLQIRQYGANAVLIKANRFDYSNESRDFALLVCDRVDAPVWKSIDVTSPDTQDGWLVQGSVPAWKVVDPMFILVTNINPSYNAFFRAVPYGGPQVQLTGPQPYDTVSGTITLQAQITDLSGCISSNISLHVSVDGYAARYSVGASNMITLDSRYNLSDWANVYATVYNHGVRVYDPTSPPMDQKLGWEAAASLPLYFDNPTYLGFASDMCSPDVGTNQILFVVSEAQEVSATFTELATGRVLASYSGYVPYAAAVAFEWDFTEWNGSPFTNDSYVVNFTAAGGSLDSPATEMSITNKVDWDGVRKGASCFMTWQPEDPATQDGPWLNRMASEWIGGPVGSGNPGALRTLYQDLYNPWGLTQYYAWHVGGDRNNPECRPMQPGIDPWSTIIHRLARTNYSELTLGPAHGNGREIGRSPQGTSYITESFTPFDLRAQVLAGGSGLKPDGSGGGGRNWRLRKAAFWTCYSGNVNLPSAGGVYETWPQACGIRPKNQQDTSWMMKNCGLFFGGEINQRGFAGGDGSISAAEVASTLDSVWVCGQNMYPGGCDPYYSFRFAVNATRGMYNPEMDKADPRIFGYYWCIYASTIDEMLTVGNTALVADPQ